MADPVNALPESLLPKLRHNAFVFLTTLDADTGAPQMNAVSWVHAVSPERIRIAVDRRSRIVANVQSRPDVAASFFGDNSFHTVNGTARIIADPLEDVPLKLACLEIEVAAVRDAMFYGSRVSVEPEYEKTYDQRAADKLDGQVFDAMTKA
ncbi:hypothetical protein J31TS4_29300 [Paenibacillus sp. J31TS4]|uniref:pyridoxamine 5'-phosphate oxidase family protein n=1 Tax=Paenibacillus sp. J31TS4 TaxID=2807195 RepID=UPI001B1F3D13|nr:pyridoxamine 5'-phosphate oxidase family protein [Paenibacillus sp. J31TS4]GIP39650.1 hypothetical protein J31TS4_29300 [Paenibacillus sp. J31TS4]